MHSDRDSRPIGDCTRSAGRMPEPETSDIVALLASGVATPVMAIGSDGAAIGAVDDRASGRKLRIHALGTAEGHFGSRAFATVDDLLSAGDWHNAAAVLFGIGDMGADDPGLVDGLRRMARDRPDIPVIVVGDREESLHVLAILSYGARGYIPAGASVRMAAEALSLVMVGGVFAPAATLADASHAAPVPSADPGTLFGLTGRQIAVAEGIIRGKPNKIIAHELGLSENTVKVHIRGIMKRLKARNRTEIAFKLQTARPRPTGHATRAETAAASGIPHAACIAHPRGGSALHRQSTDPGGPHRRGLALPAVHSSRGGAAARSSLSPASDAILRPQIELLNPAMRAAFDSPHGRQRVAPAGALLLAEGDIPSSAEVIRSGWAAGYKSLDDGRRQIVSFLLPGDLIGIPPGIAGVASATVEAITAVQLQSAGPADWGDATSPNLSALAAVQKLQMEDMLLSVGQRDAVERTAALLLDLFDRAAARQMVQTGTLAMPLTQSHLSAALGLTVVHVNRVIGTLKRAAIIELSRGRVEVIDRDRLARAARKPVQTARGTRPPSVANPAAKRVLVVEDEFHTAQYVGEILQGMGMQVIGPAASLPQAMLLAETQQVDAALLDVRLQHNDRVYPVADLLRRRRIPFSFITAYAEDSIERLPTETVLRKPFREDQLQHVVRSLMQGGSRAAGHPGG